MKSLKDSLREELKEVLNQPEIMEDIRIKKLNQDLVLNAFERLLDNNSGIDDASIIEEGRARFETYIINYLKTQNH